MRNVFLMALITLSFVARAEDAPKSATTQKTKVEAKSVKDAVNSDTAGQSPLQSDDQLLGALQTAFEKAETIDDNGAP